MEERNELPHGAWGDPTLATRENAEAVTESLVATILKDIAGLRQQSPASTK